MSQKETMKTVVELAGAVDPSLGKSLQQAQKALGGIDLKAAAMGAAFVTAGVVAVKAIADITKSLYDLGSQFDEAYDAIRIGTGATGDDLEALKDDFKDVYSSVPTTMEDASKAIADYNTRLGVTGDVLSGLSSQAIAVSDMLGEDLNATIESSSQAFQQWNIDTNNMGKEMDYVFKVSQATGASFTGLMSNLKNYGPQMQELGFSFEQSAAMMGQLEKAGVRTDEIMGALKKSVGVFAGEGVSAAEGFQKYYEAIKNAGDAAEATSLANEVFGKRAGSSVAAAIRNGTLELEAFTNAMNESDESIMKAMWDTADAAEKSQLLGQQMQVLIEPLAGAIFDGVSDLMPTISSMMQQMAPVIQKVIEILVPMVNDIFGYVAKYIEEFAPIMAELAEAVFPLLAQILAILMPLFMEIISEILPPLVTIIKALMPILQVLCAIIGEALVQAVNLVMPILTNLLDIFANIIEFIVNVFTLQWGAAWQNVVNIFADVFTGLAQLIKAPLNAVIGIINTVIAGINAMKIQIPDWVPGLGGKDFSINIPVIPMLASGGFTDGLSIAGEDGTEAVISFQQQYRSRNIDIWEKAGQMLGVGNNSSSGETIISFGDIVFAPQIKLEGGGSVNEQSLMEQINQCKSEFMDFVENELKVRLKKAYDCNG